jgi:hypothetical protein
MHEPYAKVVQLAAAAVVGIARTRPAACYESSRASVQILEQDCWDVSLELGTMRVLLLWSCSMLARLSEHAELFRAYVSEAQDRKNLYTHTTLQTGGRLWPVLLDDGVAEARHDIEAARDAWPQAGVHLQHLFAFNTLTWLDMYERPGRAAFERVQQHRKALEGSLILRLPLHREHYMRSLAAAALQAWAAGDASARPLALSALGKLARVKSPGAVPRHRALWAAKCLIEGDREAAARALRESISAQRALTIELDLPPLEEALGRIVGGDEGAMLRASAQGRARQFGIRAPERYFDMFWPAFARL